MQSCFTSLVTTYRRTIAPVVCLLALAASTVPARAQSSHDPIYVFHTNLGNISVQLFPDVTPKTVANFLNYVNAGAYTNSIIHRSVPGFIFQGGGYQLQGNSINMIQTNPPVVNEFHLSNIRGTITMAQLGTDPNSATDEWFFNEADNSANLDHQNGGFTVFGRVADSASLAVMDRIAAVPVPNPPPFNPPLNQMPLMNYMGGSVTPSELVIVSSITPAGRSHLLWTNTNGSFSVWTLNSDGTHSSTPALGPVSGTTATAIADGTDGQTRVLLRRTADGQVTVWTVNPVTGAYTATSGYGPYGPWKATALAVGSDNLTRLFWQNGSGASSVWTLNTDGSYTSTAAYGPYGPWTAKAFAVGNDNLTRLLWTTPGGQMSVWTLKANGSYTSSPAYSPPNGETALGLAVGSDTLSRVLLKNPAGTSAVWTLNADGSETNTPDYGPYGPWAANSLGVGNADLTQLFWQNGSGTSSVWTLNADGTYASSPGFGPYGPWSATAFASEP